MNNKKTEESIYMSLKKENALLKERIKASEDRAKHSREIRNDYIDELYLEIEKFERAIKSIKNRPVTYKSF